MTGDHNTVSTSMRQQALTGSDEADVKAELAALRALLAELKVLDRGVLDHATQDAAAETTNPLDSKTKNGLSKEAPRSGVAKGTDSKLGLIVHVHGINTRGEWMGVVKPALEAAGFAVAQTSFGVLQVVPFLLPISRLRKRATNRVLTDVRTAKRIYEPALMSVIAHSFGSYVIARIIAEEPDLRWHRIIFCGSVVRDNFPLHQYLERFRFPLLNEVGTKDFWPAVAESVTWGYGSVGSHGFNRPPVETRWHRGFRHSDFLTETFCTTSWVPFLRDGTIVPGDPPSRLPLWIRAMTWVPLRWIIVVLTVASIIVLLQRFQIVSML